MVNGRNTSRHKDEGQETDRRTVADYDEITEHTGAYIRTGILFNSESIYAIWLRIVGLGTNARFRQYIRHVSEKGTTGGKGNFQSGCKKGVWYIFGHNNGENYDDKTLVGHNEGKSGILRAICYEQQ